MVVIMDGVSATMRGEHDDPTEALLTEAMDAAIDCAMAKLRERLPHAVIERIDGQAIEEYPAGE